MVVLLRCLFKKASNIQHGNPKLSIALETFPSPEKVFSCVFYMGRFEGPTPKRHKLFSNDQRLLDDIAARAGYMSLAEQAACTVKTARRYVDRLGVQRHVGIKSALKQSQLLGLTPPSHEILA